MDDNLVMLYELSAIYSLIEALLINWTQVTEDEIKVALAAINDSSEKIRDAAGLSQEEIDLTLPFSDEEKFQLISTIFGIPLDRVRLRFSAKDADILTNLINKALDEAKKEKEDG